MLSCLAIKNNKPDVALDVLNSIPFDRIMSIRGLKMLAYLHLGRYIQIIPILKYGLELESVRTKPYCFFADVVCKIKVYYCKVNSISVFTCIV